MTPYWLPLTQLRAAAGYKRPVAEMPPPPRMPLRVVPQKLTDVPQACAASITILWHVPKPAPTISVLPRQPN